MDERTERAAQETAERFESIPWSALAPERHSGRSRLLITGATVVGGIVVGLAVGILLRGDDGAAVVTLPAATPETMTPATEAPLPPPSSTPAPAPQSTSAPAAEPVAAPPRPQLFSEADLMAVLPEEEQRVAVLRAEWFVTDFFTVDGSGSSAVMAALPPGFDGAVLPHDGTANGISYVEWARAFRVDPVGPGRYEVAVAFRTLSGPDAATLLRSGVRAVTVPVQVDASGASVVLDLPGPTDPPTLLAERWAEPEDGEPSTDLRALAFQAAASVGSDAGLATAGIDGDGWRLVVMIGDGSGLRWPLSVRP